MKRVFWSVPFCSLFISGICFAGTQPVDSTGNSLPPSDRPTMIDINKPNLSPSTPVDQNKAAKDMAVCFLEMQRLGEDAQTSCLACLELAAPGISFFERQALCSSSGA